MNSDIIDCSIANIVNIVQVWCSVIGISALPEKNWSDQVIFENVFSFFFTLKLLYTFLIPISKSVFFLRMIWSKKDPLNQGQKKTLTTLKVHLYQTLQIKLKKIELAFRYVLYILQSLSDQNKINVFWLGNQQQWLPMRYW